jgi:GNAT superfamily N-acetyltransferase
MFKKLSKSQLNSICESLKESDKVNENDMLIPKGIYKGKQHILEMEELPEIKKLSGTTARLRIQKHINFCIERGFISTSEKPNIPKFAVEWMNDDNSRCYYIEDDKDKIICFALYADMDFDPLEQFSNPVKLHLIHTRPDYRRKGYAEFLLKMVNRTESQVSAFSTGEKCSIELLEKCRYRTNGEYLGLLYRFRGNPPNGLYEYLMKGVKANPHGFLPDFDGFFSKSLRK